MRFNNLISTLKAVLYPYIHVVKKYIEGTCADHVHIHVASTEVHVHVSNSYWSLLGY